MVLPTADISLCARIVVAVILCAAIARPTRAEVVYVDVDATGDNDGTSWCDAFIHLQDALSRARIDATIDGIHVAGGTYRPDLGTGITVLDRSVSFDLVRGVMIRGGHAGCSTAEPDDRDPELYRTVLSGDLLGDDDPLRGGDDCPCFTPGAEPQCDDSCRDTVQARSECATGWTWQNGALPGCALLAVELCCADCSANPTRCDNSWHVIRATAIPTTFAQTTGIDGCTITAGYANGPGEYTGAGALCLSASPTFRSCTFSHNRAADDGGAVLIGSTSFPVFESCVFEDNTAGDDGGAIKNDASAPIFFDCSFRRNRAGVHNPAGDGGAVLNSTESSAEFQSCQFETNDAADSGGAVYNEGSIEPDQLTTMTIKNAAFRTNSAGVRGGAVHSVGNTDSKIAGTILFAANESPVGRDWTVRSGEVRVIQSPSGGGTESTAVTADVFEVSLDGDQANPVDGLLELRNGTTLIVDELIIKEDALNEFARPTAMVDGILYVQDKLVVGGDPGDCTPPDFCTALTAQVRVLGDIVLEGNAGVQINATAPLRLGDLLNRTSGPVAPLFFKWDGPLRLAGAEQDIEVAGADLGPLPYEQVANNFGIRTIDIDGGSTVRLTAAPAPIAPAGCPALYVETLTLEPGATLDIDDVIVYADELIDLGGSMCFSGACADLAAPQADTCQLYDINQDCTVRVTDDLPQIIECLFRDDCACADGTCVCAIDCNCDGALTVVGDGRCLVECFQQDQCPTCDERQPAGDTLAIGGIVLRSAENPLLTGINKATVVVRDAERNRDGNRTARRTTTDDLGIWSIPKLPAGTYHVHIRVGRSTDRLTIQLTAENQRRLQNILTVFPHRSNRAR